MTKKQQNRANKEEFVELISEHLKNACSLDEVLSFLLDNQIIPQMLVNRYIVINRYKYFISKGHTRHTAIKKAAEYANLPISTANSMVSNHLNYFSTQKT